MGICYRIKEWERFENNKSRERDRCSFVCIPNTKPLALRRLLAHPDGAEAYAVFVLLVAHVSTKPKGRDGHLTDTGRALGTPLTLADMQIVAERPAKRVEKAIQLLSSPEIGWIVATTESTSTNDQCPPSAREVPAECPPSVRLKEGRKEGKEEPPTPVPGDGVPPGVDLDDSTGAVTVVSPDLAADPDAQREADAATFARCWVSAECPSLLRRAPLSAFKRLILRLGKDEAVRRTVAVRREKPDVGNPFAFVETQLDSEAFSARDGPEAQARRVAERLAKRKAGAT